MNDYKDLEIEDQYSYSFSNISQIEEYTRKNKSLSVADLPGNYSNKKIGVGEIKVSSSRSIKINKNTAFYSDNLQSIAQLQEL